jgi:hypothetical protein
MLYSCFTPVSPLLIHVTAVIRRHLHILIYNPASLVLYSYFFWCVCRAYWPSKCVEESEGLRRDGAWEHGVLQQRAAGEAPLHKPSHVCVLMHVGAVQERTRGRQERPLVLAAAQVREMHAARASYDARLLNLVSLHMAAEHARREYM